MRRSTKVLVGVGAGLLGAGLAAVAGERAVRRARSRPSPEGGLDMSERPGPERRVRSFDGTELAVHVVGPKAGPTVVFVHGFSIDLTAWYFQWKAFSAQYRCVLYDQRGHGRSAPGVNHDYSLQALASDLKAVLDAEAPEGPVVLVGHSMGGMAIMAFAEAHPEEFGTRVRGVVLANTAAGDLAKEAVAGLGARLGSVLAGQTARLARNPRRVARLRARAFAGDSNIAWAIGRLTNFGPHASPALVEHVVGLAAQTSPEVWSDVFVSLFEMDLRHALEHVKVPALVLAGDVDRLTPPATGLVIARALPDARMVLFRGAGHCAMLERHEEWNEVVGGFLRTVLPEGRPKPRRRPRREATIG